MAQGLHGYEQLPQWVMRSRS